MSARSPSSRIRFVPYDCLRQLGRGTSGRHYKELAQAIRRLRVTTVITNIRLDDEAGEEQPFHGWHGTVSREIDTEQTYGAQAVVGARTQRNPKGGKMSLRAVSAAMAAQGLPQGSCASLQRRALRRSTRSSGRTSRPLAFSIQHEGAHRHIGVVGEAGELLAQSLA